MKHPCIRNLDAFKKKGCPRSDDCPCWITDFLVVNGKRQTKSQCLDLWRYDHERAMLGLLEGNQAATESFRNGMCEKDEHGKVQPKPGRFIINLPSMDADSFCKQIADNPDEIRKQLTDESQS